ncbi:hypothetical protein ACOXY6_04925, partial [Cytophagales bacterium EPR-FJ-38]
MNLKINNLDRFKNNYRIQSARAQWWDYGWNGAYFITICIREKERYFGEIVGGEMVLSDIGKIAQKYWNEIPNYFSFVTLDSFVIMPNHMHGILIIDKSDQIANSGKMGNIYHCRDSVLKVKILSKFFIFTDKSAQAR